MCITASFKRMSKINKLKFCYPCNNFYCLPNNTETIKQKRFALHKQWIRMRRYEHKKKSQSSNLLNICNHNLFSNQLTESSKWTLTANICLPNIAKTSSLLPMQNRNHHFSETFSSCKGQFSSNHDSKPHNDYHLKAYIQSLQDQIIFTF